MNNRSFAAIGVGTIVALGFCLASLAGAASGGSGCTGQHVVQEAPYACSSTRTVTHGVLSVAVAQHLTVNADGTATVEFSLPDGPVDFAVALQWISHQGLSGKDGGKSVVTGAIEPGATSATLANQLVACGGQQDIKAQPGGQETVGHISPSFRIAGPVVKLPNCAPTPPTTTPSTAPATTSPTTSPSTSPDTVTTTPGSLPATL